MKISIVTATFNSAKTVRDTIESVLAQTYPDIEYIIKDGGSKDETLDICREYEPKFNGRMKIISCPDKGIYDGMNMGLQAASGDVLAILNSDDYLASVDAVESQMKKLEESGADAVYAYTKTISEDNPKKITMASNSKLFQPWMLKMGFMLSHPTFYCKKEIYDKYGYFKTDYKIAADYEMMIRFILVNKIKLVYNKKLVLTMRDGGASSSGMASVKIAFAEQQRALRENGFRPSKFLFLMKLGVKFAFATWTKFKYNTLGFEYK